MTRRPVDSVLIAGWTSDAVTRAVRLLTVGSSVDPDEVALAQELLRWLRCAADESAAQLAHYIDTIRPSGANASRWDKLLKSLREEPLSDVLARLQAERPGLVGELCALLDDDAKQHADFESLDRKAQCAVKGLLMLGAAEGLRYLVTHIPLLCWNDTEALNQLVHPHREAFGQAAVDVWEALEDAQATARIHDLLNRALEAPAQLGADGQRFVMESISYLRRDSLTAEQRRRVSECGVDPGLSGSEVDKWDDLESSDAPGAVH